MSRRLSSGAFGAWMLCMTLHAAPAGAQLLPAEALPVLLTTREVGAVRLSRGWQNRYSPAMLGDNGRVVYHFGESSAPVITAPGNVTHIELEPGEILVEDGIFIGDSVNWRIIPVAQGKEKTSSRTLSSNRPTKISKPR